MPCNAAATLYNKSQGKISVVGINTLGVLYILDNKGEVKSVSDLKGKTIYTTGKRYNSRIYIKISSIFKRNRS